MYYTVNDPGIFLHKVYERIMKSKMSASTGPYGRINKSFFLRNFKHNWTELDMNDHWMVPLKVGFKMAASTGKSSTQYHTRIMLQSLLCLS
jgi:hypothetical protein